MNKASIINMWHLLMNINSVKKKKNGILGLANES